MKYKSLTINRFVWSATTLLLTAFTAQAQNNTEDSLRLSRLPQFTIRFHDTTSRASMNRIIASCNAHIVDSLQCFPRTYLLQINGTPSPTEIIQTSEDAKGKAGVSDAEPNYAGQTPPVNPDTTRFKYSPLPDNCLDTNNLRRNCQRNVGGDSTVIAIIDSGLDGVMSGNSLQPNAPLFQGKLWDDGTGACGFNFLNNTKAPLDTNGHGTHIAGILQQTLDLYGANAKLMILKTQDKDGLGTAWDICRAVDYAMCHGANIINMSLSYVAQDDSTATGVQRPSLLERLLVFAGNQYKILTVMAAGNNGRDIDAKFVNRGRRVRYQAGGMKVPTLISVAATRCKEELASFSNYGKKSVHLAVQGDSIFSTVLNNRWAFKSGTSMSTPFVSAAAAIVASRRRGRAFNPNLTKNIILQSVDYQPFLRDLVATKGMLNICSALIRTSETAELLTGVALNVYPNPFDNDLNIEFETENEQNVEISIYNPLGVNILQQKLNSQAGMNVWKWSSLSTLPTGIYLVELRTAQQRTMRKLMRL